MSEVAQSVLRKKLALPAVPSGAISALESVWQEIGTLFTPHLAKAIGQQIDHFKVVYTKKALAEYGTELGDQALLYSAKTTHNDHAALVRLSQDFPSLIAGRMLDIQDDDDDAQTDQEIDFLDLSLLEPLVEKLFDAASQALCPNDPGQLLSPLAKKKSGFTLKDINFKAASLMNITFTFTFDDGAKNISCTISLFADDVEKIAMMRALENDGPLFDDTEPWFAHMMRKVNTMSLPLTVILDRLDMTIGECSRLNIGDILELPGATTEHLSIEVEMDSQPLKVGVGKLGVLKNYKALCMNEAVDSCFVHELQKLKEQ